MGKHYRTSRRSRRSMRGGFDLNDYNPFGSSSNTAAGTQNVPPKEAIAKIIENINTELSKITDLVKTLPDPTPPAATEVPAGAPAAGAEAQNGGRKTRRRRSRR